MLEHPQQTALRHQNVLPHVATAPGVLLQSGRDGILGMKPLVNTSLNGRKMTHQEGCSTPTPRPSKAFARNQV